MLQRRVYGCDAGQKSRIGQNAHTVYRDMRCIPSSKLDLRAVWRIGQWHSFDYLRRHRSPDSSFQDTWYIIHSLSRTGKTGVPRV